MLEEVHPYILEISVGVILLILIGLVVRLEIKLKRLLRGKDARSLEDSILTANNELDKLEQFRVDATEHFKNVEKRLDRSIQSVETIRFNPFKGTGDGGNQSFSTAFLSQNGKGAIVSSLYSRDRISIFSKPIENFTSTFDLSPEELDVLDTAKKNLK